MARILYAAVALCLSVSLASAEDKVQTAKDREVKPVEKLEKKDRPVDNDFLVAAAQHVNNCQNVLEVVGKQASNDKVKEFAKRVREEHDALIKEHGEVAKAHKVVTIPSLDKEASNKITELKKKEGAEFDRTFLANFIEGHEKAIAVAENQKASGKDEDTRKLAERGIEVMKKHVAEAKKLQDEIK